jgi:hypothetical protein
MHKGLEQLQKCTLAGEKFPVSFIVGVVGLPFVRHGFIPPVAVLYHIRPGIDMRRNWTGY